MLQRPHKKLIDHRHDPRDADQRMRAVADFRQAVIGDVFQPG